MSLKLEGNDKTEQDYVREKAGGMVSDYKSAYEPSFLDLLENQILPIVK